MTASNAAQVSLFQQLKTGAGSRIRTDDLLITNQLLYQLSYAGIYEGKLLSFTVLSRRIVYAICIPWHKTKTKCAIPIRCHRAPLSAFLFSRQADSLTRFRYSRVIARLLRPSSNSSEALWEHGEALPCQTGKNLFGKAQRFKT